MRVAMAQISGTDLPSRNRQIISEYVARATDAGAGMVVFPEETLVRLEPVTTPRAPTAEALDGPCVTHIRELARRHRIAVIAGMTERIEGEAVRAYNTVVAVGTAGEMIGSYRKIHLFDALGSVESDTTTPGDGTTLVFPFADHVVGIATCYDLRFPELARRLIDRGANVLVYPSAWYRGLLKEDHWEVLLRARAIENVSWVIGVSHAEGRHIGRSMIVDPMGVITTALAEEPALGIGEVDARRVVSARCRNPSLDNRRPGVTHGALES